MYFCVCRHVKCAMFNMAIAKKDGIGKIRVLCNWLSLSLGLCVFNLSLNLLYIAGVR